MAGHAQSSLGEKLCHLPAPRPRFGLQQPLSMGLGDAHRPDSRHLRSVVNLGLVLISGLTQNFEFHSIFGATRDNIYAHVLGFLPRNTSTIRSPARLTLVG